MLFRICLNSYSFSSFTYWSVMYRGSHSLTNDIRWDATLQNSIKLVQVDDNCWRVFGITSFCVCVDCILFTIIVTACYSQMFSCENVSSGIPESSLEPKKHLLFNVIRSPWQHIS